MRLSTPLLFDLARSTDVAEPGPEEQRVLIPPTVQAHVSLQRANRNLFFDNVTVFRDSFAQEVETFQSGAAVGSSTVVARFAAGLWDVWGALTHVTDLAEAITIDPRAGLQLQDPGGGQARLLVALAGTFQTAREARWRWLFPEDGWNLVHFVEATVAGQERYAHSVVSAALLL